MEATEATEAVDWAEAARTLAADCPERTLWTEATEADETEATEAALATDWAESTL